jgi:hypothetical protein
MWRLLPLLLSFPLAAHQFHYSRTEVNWNSSASAIEVVATLHADDIEAVLRQLHRRQIELDGDKDAEALVCAYIVRTLEFRGVRLRCLGMKVSVHFVDVFLEGGAARPPQSLRNRILTEEIADQRNDVELKRDGKLLGPRIQFNSLETERDLRW